MGGHKNESGSGSIEDARDIRPGKCSFGWEKLIEMKETRAEFWTADGNSRLRIIEANKISKTLHMMCCQTGKITWPLKYEKLEDIHARVHRGEVGLIPNEIERCAPTWGNYITGLLKYLGCQKEGPAMPDPGSSEA